MSKLYYCYVLLLFIGLLPLTLGMYMSMQEKKIRARCQFKIMGTVTGYQTKGLPKYEVEFVVKGKVYKITNDYRRVSRVPGFLAKNKKEVIYVDAANVLHITLGKAYDKTAFLKKLQPMNAKLPVFYDPEDPNNAFVKEVPSYNTRVASALTNFGAVLVFIACVLSFWVKK